VDTEEQGFPEPDTPSPWAESLRQMDGQLSLAAENGRLRAELAVVRDELAAAEGALTTVEAELEQAIKFYPTPDEVVVLREDLRIVLTGLADDTGAIGRVAAAVGL
jgi:hypothetical protein